MQTQYYLLHKILKNPIGTVLRVMYKVFIGPIKYGRGKNDYNAKVYWENRLGHYQLSYKGAGEEGLSEEENRRVYSKKIKTITKIIKTHKINLRSASVLEIGCGSGFITEHLHKKKCKLYTGIDITNILFPTLIKKFPNYIFVKKDITNSRLQKKYDLILMIDVIEHIVTAKKLQKALNNAMDMLKKNGVLVLSPVMEEGKRYFFYLKTWSTSDITKTLPPLFKHSVHKLFRDHMLLEVFK